MYIFTGRVAGEGHSTAVRVKLFGIVEKEARDCIALVNLLRIGILGRHFVAFF